MNEVLSASNLDPSALTMVTRKLEVGSFSANNSYVAKIYIMCRMYWTQRTVLSEISNMNWLEYARYCNFFCVNFSPQTLMHRLTMT